MLKERVIEVLQTPLADKRLRAITYAGVILTSAILTIPSTYANELKTDQAQITTSSADVPIETLLRKIAFVGITTGFFLRGLASARTEHEHQTDADVIISKAGLLAWGAGTMAADTWAIIYL